MKNINHFKASPAMMNHKGFTLVEVLIALLVLGILFVPVSNAFLQSVHLNQHMKQRVTATRDSQTALEVTKSLLNEHSIQDVSETVDNAPALFNEQINRLMINIATSGLIEADTTVEIIPLHEDSPFLLITATSSYTAEGSSDDFNLTTLHLPGEAPWLAPKEYRVVTP